MTRLDSGRYGPHRVTIITILKLFAVSRDIAFFIINIKMQLCFTDLKYEEPLNGQHG